MAPVLTMSRNRIPASPAQLTPVWMKLPQVEPVRPRQLGFAARRLADVSKPPEELLLDARACGGSHLQPSV